MKNKFQKISNPKLTSVKMECDEYKSFKSKTAYTGITLQELVNLCVYLYNHNEQFVQLVHENIIASGSII